MAIKDAKRLGKLVVYELDDDIFHIDPKSPAHEFWRNPENQRKAKECMREAHLVTTSTNYLAKLLKPINPKVVVLPNMLPKKFWQVKRDEHPSKLVIGWAGGSQHLSDLELLRGVIEQILNDYGQVEVFLAGMPVLPFQPHPRLKTFTWTKVEQYPKEVLAKMDIGLAPLVNHHFNRAKSDLKFIEYGILGIPMIGSPVQPYLEAVEHGKTGFLAKSPKDWLKYLRKLIENEELRKEIGENARKVAQKRFIEDNAYRWEKVYWENLQKVRQKAQPITPPAPPFQFPQ